MLFSPFSTLGDARGANSIMVASNAGSVYGSYPFASSYHEGMYGYPVVSYPPWIVSPIRGDNHQDRLDGLAAVGQSMKDAEVRRYPTIPYVPTRHAPTNRFKNFEVKARAKAPSKAFARRSNKKISKGSHRGVKPKDRITTFGNRPISQMTTRQLESLIKREFNDKLFSSVEEKYPSIWNPKHPDNVRAYKNAIIRAASKIVHEAMEEIHPVTFTLPHTWLIDGFRYPRICEDQSR